jgi:GTP pyrophosphokinase
MKHSQLSAQPHDSLARKLCAGFREADALRIEDALSLAMQAKEADRQLRPRGVEVAGILHHLKVDAPTLEAALLSDPYLRETLKESYIRAHFGETVANLVDKVNWLNTFTEYTQTEIQEPEQAELLRRMLLAVVNDVRAVLIKLAYRVQRLRMLAGVELQLRYSVAKETLAIFSPLANRLGIGQLKWELEDLSFRYLNPEEYKKLARALAANRAEREAYIDHFIVLLEKEFKQYDIHAKIYGRPKHLYSIWRKIERKQVDINDLFDLLAVRVIVDKIQTCYSVLGIIHSKWLHIPKEFDDYIANPKSNGYRSLHTVVIGAEGRAVEIQIRTREMHMFAEYGIAAHWRYKEGGPQDAAFDRNIASLRRLLDSREDDHSLLEHFRAELFTDEIFVLTPKGQIVRLTKDATPLDFAYAIHTEVGHRCRGAKVNGHIVPLTYALKSGERVEILTAKHGGPSLGWLDVNMGYVKTAHARNKIKQWFKQQDHERHQRAGKSMLEKEKQKLGLKELDINELAAYFRFNRPEDLLIAVGRADISPAQLATALRIPGLRPAEVSRQPTAEKTRARSHAAQVTIQGIRNLFTHFAKCCAPAPGDEIIGYVTIGKGVTIHRQDCRNIIRLAPERHSRLIDVNWGDDSEEAFPVEIEVTAIDRKGLLKDITQILANERINIVRTSSYTNAQDRSVGMNITLEVSQMAQLSLALEKISQVHNVLDARRKA